MRYIIHIEDTLDGIRAYSEVGPNGITDNILGSLGGHIIASWTKQMQELEDRGLLVVEHPVPRHLQ